MNVRDRFTSQENKDHSKSQWNQLEIWDSWLAKHSDKRSNNACCK